MEAIHMFQQILSSGADAAMVIFAIVLWKVDRRLLVVEMNLQHIWRKIAVTNGRDENMPTE